MGQWIEAIYREGHVLIHNTVKVQTGGFKLGTVTRSWQDGQVQLRKYTCLALDQQGIWRITHRGHIP